MSRRLLYACAGAAALLAATSGPQRISLAESPARLPASDASAVIDAVNSLRQSRGLAPYATNSILMGTAQGQADYMASLGSWSHTGPGGSTVTQRLLEAGYPLAGDLSLGGFRSENVVASPGMTPADAVNSWTTDSVHLNTMLSTDLQEIGAGVSERDGVYYYVIDCARPTSSGAPEAYTPGAESAYSAGMNEIIVPVSLSTPNAKGEIIHEVKAGQSLWQIAIAYGVKIDQIRSLNLLPTAYLINPGDTLHIKTVETPTPQPPTAVPTISAPLPTVSARTQVPSEPPTEVPTPSPTPEPPLASPMDAGGAVGAIIFVALAAAGLVAWAGRARPV